LTLGGVRKVDNSREISVNKQIEEQRRLFHVAITRCKSSETAYAGKLIISSFVGLPGNEASAIGIKANPYYWRSVSASRFIRDFGETAPATTTPRKQGILAAIAA